MALTLDGWLAVWVSPRPAPTRSDATAVKFLNAAASLIDAALSTSEENVPPRLRQIHFPAALDWVRTEDVLRMTAGGNGEGESRKAFRNRWASKEEFVRDAIVHAMLYRDREGVSTAQTRARLFEIAADSPSPTDFVTTLTREAEKELLGNPRSWLLAHVAPLLGRHPDLHAPLRDMMRGDADYWLVFYSDVLTASGFSLRAPWTPERATWAMQALLDGVILRHRVDPERMADEKWCAGNMFADTVLAFCAGIMDAERSGESVKEWIDRQLGVPSPPRGAER